MKIYQSILVASLLCGSLIASPIADEDGFSGYVSAGTASMNFKSNMIAGTVFDDEITHASISTIDGSADSKTTPTGTINLNVKYTFADAKTEVFVGRELYDVLSFDDAATLGVRKYFNNIGILGVGLLKSSIPTKVWEDPYATGVNRSSTEMTTMGLSLKWEGILHTNFEVELRSRKIDIEAERSATTGTRNGEYSHGLTDSELNYKLNREGDLRQVIGRHVLVIENNEFLKTSVKYNNYDLDGKAMQHDKLTAELEYLYVGKKWNFIAVVNAATDYYRETNPLFNDKANAFAYGGSFTAMYKNPFDLSPKLSIIATAANYKYDSDINFYDTSATMLHIGAVYNF